MDSNELKTPSSKDDGKKKEAKSKKGRGPVIIMQVFAVLFLILGFYLSIVSWNGYSVTASQYNLEIGDVLGSVVPAVMSAGGPYLAFAVIMYGISMILDHQIQEKK